MIPNRTSVAWRVLSSSLIGATLLALPALAWAQTQNWTSPVVVATGQSEISVAPDQAWVIVSIDTRELRGPDARRLGAVAMTSVVAAIKTTGVADDAVKTIGFSLRPEYEFPNGRQRLKGFVVSNQVQVRVDDIERVADVLDAVGGLALPPSSTTTIGNLRFDLRNRAELERQALRHAVQDATERARMMADGAGRNLGAALLIEEVGGGSAVKFQENVMMARAGDAMVATPVSPADIVIRATVRVTMVLMGRQAPVL